MHAFLTNLISDIMLPLFVIMILCAIAGAKPEPIVNGVIDIVVSLITGIFKLAMAIVSGLVTVLIGARHRSQDKSKPASEYPKRRRTDR